MYFKAAVIYKQLVRKSRLISLILAGVISICAGLTTAELAAAIPETGGMILVWVERAYGKTAHSGLTSTSCYLLSS